MNASDWIALVALLVAIGVAIRGELNVRAERRDREKEDKRRDEELELLREQVGLQVEDRQRANRAELVCRQRGHGGESEGIDYYEVVLHNSGPATARDVEARIATEAGEPLSNPQRLTPIPRDEDSPQFKLLISMDESRDRQRPLFIRASWADGAGEHVENLEELSAF
jgi:hypothetical protein